MQHSNFYKTFLILFLTVSFLILLELIHPYVPFLNQTEPPHFWTAYSDTLSTVDSSDNAMSIMDTLGLSAAIQDAPNTNPEDTLNNPLWIMPRDSIETYVEKDVLANYEGKNFLESFFQALVQLKQKKKKKVRVAYFGDSTTQGDLCVGNLRDTLQRMFGGRGVGFVPLITKGTGTRTTLKHSYPKKVWNRKQYFRNEKNIVFKFGISGDYSTSKGQGSPNDYWVRFKAGRSKDWPTMDALEKVYLYYGHNHQQTANNHTKVQVKTDSSTQSFELDQNETLNKLLINEQASQQLNLNFSFPEPHPIYGLSFEDEEGIYIDNISKRNDSGSHFHKIDSAILAQFNEDFDYDLIVLHYGPNVLSKRLKTYKHYEEILIRTINHLKKSMPNIPILVIGNSDQGTRFKGKITTHPHIEGLIKAQKMAAVRTRSGFLNLYEAMGGKGTMVKWAKASPPKVSKDYVHFSHAGARVIGQILFDYITKDLELQ